MYTYKGYFSGITLRLLGLLAFSLMSVGFITFSKQLPLVERMFIVYIVTICALTPIYVYRRRAIKKNNGAPNSNMISLRKSTIYYFLRALLGTIGILSWVNAVKHMGGAEATLVTSLAPLVATLLSVLFKQEKMDIPSILGMILCFGVTAFALNVRLKLFTIGFIFAFCATFASSLYMVVCRIQSRTEDSIIQSYYTFLASIVIMAPFVNFEVIMTDLVLVDVLPLTIMGLFRVSNIILFFVALKLTPMSIIMLTEYSQFVFMAITDYFVMGIKQSAITWIASAIVVIVSALLAYYQGQKIEKN